MNFVESLNQALRTRMSEDNRVYLLGADIGDPYGGAFKATRGLGDTFPGRLLSTPVSEAALVGMAAGMALNGLLPIVEIMFGDFLGLTFDQLLNHATKFPALYGADCRCPVVLRSPVGGGRGYGATHSQSVEKHFLGMPGLRVVALGPHSEPLSVLREVQQDREPTLIVEAKSCYGEPMRDAHYWRTRSWCHERFELGGCPATAISPVPREQCRVTVLAYGAMAVRLEPLIWRHAVERELFCEMLVLTVLNARDLRPLIERIAVTGRAITIEEGAAGWHWGAGLQDRLRQLRGFGATHFETLAARAAPIPSGLANEELAQIHDAEIHLALDRITRRP